ncbi:pth11-like integral membrane [Pyrenophora seminiperda CCB06]|uniref:Pth11-like integral membrane n=1 Tax=Pyrenophora seminiperda CCB06 TaxID=1302712 RepID=A0A3M7MA66_9PLEO|nr:pth11-like integral membrane [Pyrenophora seminiperda CCB06]
MTVFLRLFTRLVISRSAGLEDLCIVIAMVLSIALSIQTAAQVMNGLGRHADNLDPSQLDIILKAFWAGVWVYNLALTVTKIAILVQYLRIFPLTCFRKACFSVLGFVVCWGTWTVLSSIFICTPVAYSWDKSIHNGRCFNQLILWVMNAGVNIVQDVVIFLMPLFVVRTLQIAKAQKKALLAIVTLVSIVRLYSLDNIANSNDVPFDNPDHATLSAVEVNVAIICACLPAMRPLFALLMPQYFSSAAQLSSFQVLDIERAKNGQKPQTSPRPATRPPTAYTTRPSTARTYSDRSEIRRPNTATRADSAQSVVTLQSLKPTLSRTTSGLLPPMPNRPSQLHLSSRPGHSRNPSNSSIQSNMTTTTQGRSTIHNHGRIDPLRMSPVTAFCPNPAFPPPQRAPSPLGLAAHRRQPSNASMRPRTPGIDKQLPKTPFPVGSVPKFDDFLDCTVYLTV